MKNQRVFYAKGQRGVKASPDLAPIKEAKDDASSDQEDDQKDSTEDSARS